MAGQSITNIDDLRASIEKRVTACRVRLQEAQIALQFAEAEVRAAEAKLAEASADAEMRLSAIRLVAEMLAESEGRNLHPYRELSQEDAMRKALLSSDRPLTSKELAEALKAGGYPFTSTNPANAIIVAANVNRKKYFVTEKEGNRAFIGLTEWMADRDPFEGRPTENNDPSDIGSGSFGFSGGEK